MASYNDLVVSARDAESLASVMGGRRRGAEESEALDALAEMLMEARMVPHDELPANRVAMNSRVTYREGAAGEARTIVLVHPGEADAALRRISVLSPVGRSLLGRRPGDAVEASVPGGRGITLHVLEVEAR